MAKHKDFKKPHTKNTAHIQIKSIETQPDYDQLKPIFSLKHMHYLGNNCISKCDEKSKASILEKLLKITQLTWREIKSQPKAGLGFEVIPRFRFKAQLPAIVTQEVPMLIFRFSDGGRMAGYRDNDIYHVLLVGTNLYSH